MLPGETDLNVPHPFGSGPWGAWAWLRGTCVLGEPPGVGMVKYAEQGIVE